MKLRRLVRLGDPRTDPDLAPTDEPCEGWRYRASRVGREGGQHSGRHR
jgi:hypothetical protein